MSIATVIREYGQAMRGDWSEIDGRWVRDDMDTIARWISGDAYYVSDLCGRESLGLCPSGRGHWDHHCDLDCKRPT